MAHLSSIGANFYSDLAVAYPAVPLTPAQLTALDTAAEFQALFATMIEPTGTAATGTFFRIPNIREFPAIGTPANIVNVPGYGSKISRQVQGQSDAPTLEVTINLVVADWDKSATNLLGNMVGDGKLRAYRFTLLNTKPDGYASDVAGLGTVENSQYYWVGKLESLLINPQLTDAATGTISLTLQSDFFGPFTI